MEVTEHGRRRDDNVEPNGDTHDRKFQYAAEVDAKANPYTLCNREIDMHVVAFYIVVASVLVIQRCIQVA